MTRIKGDVAGFVAGHGHQCPGRRGGFSIASIITVRYQLKSQKKKNMPNTVHRGDRLLVAMYAGGARHIA